MLAIESEMELFHRTHKRHSVERGQGSFSHAISYSSLFSLIALSNQNQNCITPEGQQEFNTKKWS
jgi:hypothetical protein